ncbi:hydrogenase expression protein HypF [Streptomyces himastatinicus]
MGGTVRGEEEQAADGSPRRARTGPRHAAPRKSVLTRLQVPAGKAIALAAMPTAVLMGMGLTPQLASANTRAEDRYKAGPCVSQPDEADKDDAEGKKDASDGNDKSDKDGTDGKDQDGTSGSKTPSDSSGSSRGGDTAPAKPTPTPTTPTPSPSGSSGSGGEEESEEPSASPSPSESETKNPLDPLGIGDKLHDVFNPDEDDASAEPSATPSPSASSATPSPSASTEKKADNPVKDTVDKVGDGVKDTVDKGKKAVGDAKDKADKALPKPSPSDGADGGKVGYPCPEFDADAYKNAEDEPTASLLPDDPWVLKTTMLSLHGLDYKGIVDVKTHNGQSKKVLKFTAEGVDIKDLHQLVKGPAGTTTNVAADEGSTSTFRNGTVTMYTEELKGNLLGIIPITFSPKTPPPVNIPEVFFTDVTVTQAGQFGGELTIPGMHVYKTGE